jgi:hypothetical protein
MNSFTSRRFREAYANLPRTSPSQYVSKRGEHIACFGVIRRTPA